MRTKTIKYLALALMLTAISVFATPSSRALAVGFGGVAGDSNVQESTQDDYTQSFPAESESAAEEAVGTTQESLSENTPSQSDFHPQASTDDGDEKGFDAKDLKGAKGGDLRSYASFSEMITRSVFIILALTGFCFLSYTFYFKNRILKDKGSYDYEAEIDDRYFE